MEELSRALVLALPTSDWKTGAAQRENLYTHASEVKKEQKYIYTLVGVCNNKQLAVWDTHARKRFRGKKKYWAHASSVYCNFNHQVSQRERQNGSGEQFLIVLIFLFIVFFLRIQ